MSDGMQEQWAKSRMPSSPQQTPQQRIATEILAEKLAKDAYKQISTHLTENSIHINSLIGQTSTTEIIIRAIESALQDSTPIAAPATDGPLSRSMRKRMNVQAGRPLNEGVFDAANTDDAIPRPTAGSARDEMRINLRSPRRA
jgi:hypothetical protein